MKKKIIAFLAVFILSINICVLPAFAYRFDSDEKSGYIESLPPTYSDALNFFTDYLASKNTAFINMMPREAHYILLSSDINATNNVNYLFILVNTSETSVVRSGQSIKCSSYISEYEINFNAYRRGSEYELTRNSWSHQESGGFYVDQSYTVLESDLTILNGEGEVIRPPDENIDFNANISYDPESDLIKFYCQNNTEDITLGMLCGITNYQNYSMANVGAGLDFTQSVPLQSVIDWANDNNADYGDYVCWLTVYNGIDVIDHQEISITSLLTGETSNDDMFDEKKDYLPMPDYDDYVDWTDWPDFPTLEPFPSFPERGDSDLWEYLFSILQWIGQCILTPFRNLFLILQWLVSVVIEFGVKIGQSFKWLSACLMVIIQNIGIALYNLVVDLRALVIRLFVPKKLNFETKFREKFPIFWQIKNVFDSFNVADNQYLYIDIMGHSASISCISSLGASNCATFYNISTYIIGLFGLISMFNIVASVFNMSLQSFRGGDE